MALLLSSSSSNRHVLPLNDLSLGEVPELLQDLPVIANWYEAFGGLEGAAHTFDTLVLRHNNISRKCFCVNPRSGLI